jgi:hypothetical protein
MVKGLYNASKTEFVFEAGLDRKDMGHPHPFQSFPLSARTGYQNFNYR